MKKLLSLLIVLTIGGTAVPTTIAASHYQKEENLNIVKRQNIKINVSLLTNLETDLENILYVDNQNIFSRFTAFNQDWINSLTNKQKFDFNTYLRVGNINTRTTRANIYFDKNSSFEGTITVSWHKSHSGDNYRV